MKVTATLQADNNPPTDVVWAKDTDELGVIQAVINLILIEQNEDPWTPKVLDIHIEP